MQYLKLLYVNSLPDFQIELLSNYFKAKYKFYLIGCLEEDFSKAFQEQEWDIIFITDKLLQSGIIDFIIDNNNKKPKVILSEIPDSNLTYINFVESSCIIHDLLESTLCCINKELEAFENKCGLKYYEGRTNKYKQDIEKANKILYEVINAMNFILTKDINRETLEHVLEIFGKATNVTNVNIYEKLENKYCIVFQWNSKGKPEYIEVKYECSCDIPSITHGLTKDLNPSDWKNILEKLGIISYMYIPLNIKDNIFWGFLGFEDKVTLKTWSDVEISALSVVTSLLATLVNKYIENKSINNILDFAIDEQKKFSFQLDEINERLS